MKMFFVVAQQAQIKGIRSIFGDYNVKQYYNTILKTTKSDVAVRQHVTDEFSVTIYKYRKLWFSYCS